MGRLAFSSHIMKVWSSMDASCVVGMFSTVIVAVFSQVKRLLWVYQVGNEVVLSELLPTLCVKQNIATF
jgi:hypothetical protein